MLRKTIKFTDFNGVEKEKVYCFNLTDAELTQLNFSVKGGLEKKLEDIIASQDMNEILSIFKEIILLSYGIPSEDGERFIKTDQLREEFSQTAAYSALYMDLLDDVKAAEFINGIVPKDKRMSKEEIDKNAEEVANKYGISKSESEVEQTSEETTEVEEDKAVDLPTNNENK